jgi:hypothetical protein
VSERDEPRKETFPSGSVPIGPRRASSTAPGNRHTVGRRRWNRGRSQRSTCYSSHPTPDCNQPASSEATGYRPCRPARTVLYEGVASERNRIGRLSSQQLLVISGLGVSDRLIFVQVFGRRHEDSFHALWRPASKKRQGTKSREVGHRRCNGHGARMRAGSVRRRIGLLSREHRFAAAACGGKEDHSTAISLCDVCRSVWEWVMVWPHRSVFKREKRNDQRIHAS